MAISDFKNKRRQSLAAIGGTMVAAALSACGGGGDSSSPAPAPTPAPTPTPAPAPTPTPAPAPAPVTAKIMPMGASLTVGDELVGGSFRSYRGYLYNQLIATNYLVDFIGSQSVVPNAGGDADHEGYFGATIGTATPGENGGNNLYDRLPSMLPSGVNPDIILLMFGWNSVLADGVAAATKFSDFVAAVLALKPNAKLLIGTLHPHQTYPTESLSDANIVGYTEFNNKARELAATAGDNVYLVDLARAGFVTADWNDAVHWTDTGALRAEQAIYNALVTTNNLLAGSKS